MPDDRNEILGTSMWLKATIEADATLDAMISGAYLGIIPEEVSLPAVRYEVMGARDVRGIGVVRILSHIDWMVLVVREGLDVAPLIPIADRLDFVLNEASGQNSNVWVGACFRLDPFYTTERSESGVQYRHAGGIYRTMVQAK